MTPRLLTRFGDVFYAYDKPEGMAVHPNDERLPDLVAWLRKQRALPRDLKPGHRLDRATSGVVLCGAGRAARAQIGKWIPEATKTYVALIAGSPDGDEGVFAQPLKDHQRRRVLEATTRYRVRERLHRVTLVELDLVSGRKHQLRRHLADAGFPIIGDKRYGPKRPLRVPAFPGRLWLHAEQLVLPERTITAVLPPELAQHLDVLRGSPAAEEPNSP